MRTFLLLCIVAIVGAIVLALAFGVLDVTTDHSDGNYVLAFTVHADKLAPAVDRVEHDLHHETQAAGKIANTDRDKKEFTLANDSITYTFHLSDDCKITVDNNPGAVNDLHAGQHAEVTYHQQGDQLIATSVRVGDHVNEPPAK